MDAILLKLMVRDYIIYNAYIRVYITKQTPWCIEILGSMLYVENVPIYLYLSQYHIIPHVVIIS